MIDLIAKTILSFTGKKKKKTTPVQRTELPNPPPVSQRIVSDHDIRQSIAVVMVDHGSMAMNNDGFKEHIRRNLAYKLIEELIKEEAIEFREEAMIGSLENKFTARILYIKK